MFQSLFLLTCWFSKVHERKLSIQLIGRLDFLRLCGIFAGDGWPSMIASASPLAASFLVVSLLWSVWDPHCVEHSSVLSVQPWASVWEAQAVWQSIVWPVHLAGSLTRCLLLGLTSSFLICCTNFDSKTIANLEKFFKSQ